MSGGTRKIRTKESIRKRLELADLKPLPDIMSFNITHKILCEAMSTYLSDHVFKYPVKVIHIRVDVDNVLLTKSDTREYYIHAIPDLEETNGSV